jgi:hypothetical protein
MDSNTTRPEHYKSASEAGTPFLLMLYPFDSWQLETEFHIVLETLGWHHDAYLFQAAAYLWRLGKKDPIVWDLEKTLWYLKRHNQAFGLDRRRAATKATIAAIEEYLAGIKPNEQ